MDLNGWTQCQFGAIVDGSETATAKLKVLEHLVSIERDLRTVPEESPDGIHWRIGWISPGFQHRLTVWRRDSAAGALAAEEVANVFAERTEGTKV